MPFWATVCKTVRPMLSDSCPVLSCMSVCLSATLVYCGQTVGRIKKKLGKQVGLGPGHIVLDGDQAPPKGGTASPIFGQYLLWRNGWVDQDVTWYGGRPRPRRHCVRLLDGDPAPPQKKRHSFRPIFGPCLLWPNG